MAFGTGLHPTTRLCLAGVESLADRGLARRRARPRRRLRVGDPRDRRAQARRARRRSGVDTDPIAIEATAANAARNRLGRRLAAREGSLPSGEAPFDVVLANLIASVLVALAPLLRDELAAGRRRCSRRGSSSTASPRSGRRSSRPGSRSSAGPPKASGSPWRRSGAESGRIARRPPAYNRADAARCFPSSSSPTSSWPSACSCRRSCCRSRSGRAAQRRRARTGSSGSCSGCRPTARVIIGLGLAATGIGLVTVLGGTLLGQPWLLVALAIYAANLALAFFIQRPNLRRLIGIRAAAGRPRLAGPGEAPALRQLRDGRPRRDDRVPHEHEAEAVVTRRPDAPRSPNLGCKVNQSEMESAARLLRERGVARRRRRRGRGRPRPRQHLHGDLDRRPEVAPGRPARPPREPGRARSS